MNAQGAATAVAAIALAGYMFAVIYQGNPDLLLEELSKELGFVEFMVALYIVRLLIENKATAGIAGPIVGIAVVAALLQFVSLPGTQSALNAFRQGQAGLLDTILSAFGAKKTAE